MIFYNKELEELSISIFSKTVTYNMNPNQKIEFLDKMQRRFPNFQFQSENGNIDHQIKEILQHHFTTPQSRYQFIHEYRGKGAEDWDQYYEKVFGKNILKK